MIDKHVLAADAEAAEFDVSVHYAPAPFMAEICISARIVAKADNHDFTCTRLDYETLKKGVEEAVRGATWFGQEGKA